MKKKIIFVCFLIPAIGMLITGITYLTKSQIMSYHIEGLGYSSWDELSSNAQILTINFMKSAATGFITYAIALFFLLIIPFRKGERWSVWAMFILSLWQLGMIALRTYQVQTLTEANPPLTGVTILIVFAVMGFLIAITNKTDAKH